MRLFQAFLQQFILIHTNTKMTNQDIVSMADRLAAIHLVWAKTHQIMKEYMKPYFQKYLKAFVHKKYKQLKSIILGQKIPIDQQNFKLYLKSFKYDVLSNWQKLYLSFMAQCNNNKNYQNMEFHIIYTIFMNFYNLSQQSNKSREQKFNTLNNYIQTAKKYKHNFAFNFGNNTFDKLGGGIEIAFTQDNYDEMRKLAQNNLQWTQQIIDTICKSLNKFELGSIISQARLQNKIIQWYQQQVDDAKYHFPILLNKSKFNKLIKPQKIEILYIILKDINQKRAKIKQDKKSNKSLQSNIFEQTNPNKSIIPQQQTIIIEANPLFIFDAQGSPLDQMQNSQDLSKHDITTTSLPFQ